MSEVYVSKAYMRTQKLGPTQLAGGYVQIT